MTLTSKPNTLDAVLADIWTRLVRGGADRRSAFHTPIVASMSSDGAPQQRVMVLRKCIEADATMRFHTDLRSTKVSEIGDGARVSVLGYDPVAKIQIRASGLAMISNAGEQADAAWAASSPSSRRCYLTRHAPGSVSEKPISGLPASLKTRVPERSETEAGRVNFAVLTIKLDTLEWLYLAHDGHVRARFSRMEGAWKGKWLIP
jgi:pyridoxine/pyridoxamine 5'-phosphate oxidase